VVDEFGEEASPHEYSVTVSPYFLGSLGETGLAVFQRLHIELHGNFVLVELCSSTVTLSLFLLRIRITTLHLELAAMFNTLPGTLASILRRLYGGNFPNGSNGLTI
jgi:hypothetical protein